jgi:hypothetical protein
MGNSKLKSEDKKTAQQSRTQYNSLGPGSVRVQIRARLEHKERQEIHIPKNPSKTSGSQGMSRVQAGRI